MPRQQLEREAVLTLGNVDILDGHPVRSCGQGQTPKGVREVDRRLGSVPLRILDIRGLH